MARILMLSSMILALFAFLRASTMSVIYRSHFGEDFTFCSALLTGMSPCSRHHWAMTALLQSSNRVAAASLSAQSSPASRYRSENGRSSEWDVIVHILI